MIRLALLAVALAVVGCNVPEVDYIVTDGALPSTTFRDGLDGYGGTQDTFIDSMAPMTAQGASQSLQWTTSNNTHALLRFDGIMDRIPATATIRDALLELYIVTPGSPSGMLFEIVGNWDESTTYNTFGATPGVQPSEDRTTQQIGIINGGAVGAASFHVGASVSRWKQNPALNKGWVFIPNDGSLVVVRSRESPIEDQRPGLTVIYSE